MTNQAPTDATTVDIQDAGAVPLHIALYVAFDGFNACALARFVEWPAWRVQQAVFAASREHALLVSLLDAGISLSPAQQLRLGQLQ
ncbi:MAG: hypothetical protein K2Y10_10955 [Burkholderiaceae bacterium]|nr:hypothetical protein [Burkholderiaceae bacterium]